MYRCGTSYGSFLFSDMFGSREIIIRKGEISTACT
jgi:hypothetical protein